MINLIGIGGGIMLAAFGFALITVGLLMYSIYIEWGTPRYWQIDKIIERMMFLFIFLFLVGCGCLTLGILI